MLYQPIHRLYLILVPVTVVIIYIISFFTNFNLPQNVLVSNVEISRSTVSWLTNIPEKDTLIYTDNPYLFYILPFSYFWLNRISDDLNLKYHSQNLKSLKPNTTYYLAIQNGVHFYKLQRKSSFNYNDKLIFLQTTRLPVIKTLTYQKSVTFNTVKGIVINSNYVPLPNIIIIININQSKYSGMTDTKGVFNIQIPKPVNSIYISAIKNISKQSSVTVDAKIINQPVMIVLN